MHQEDATRMTTLLEELRECRAATPGMGRETHFRNSLDLTRQMLHDVPLVHVTSASTLEKVLFSGALQCRDHIGRRVKPHQTYLGTEDSVYTAAGLPYPNGEAALIFVSKAEEVTPAAASPWDTGLFCKRLCRALPPMPDPRRRETFLHHTLPAPLYREYLVHYVASCFEQATDYLTGRPFRYADPLEAMDVELPLSRRFEVRFRGKLPTTEPGLAAVFLPGPEDTLPESLWGSLDRLRRGGVVVRYYKGAREVLQQRVTDWLLTGPCRGGR